MGMILETGGDDCVDLYASLFRVCGRYGSQAQKSRAMNDRSGGSRVLVAGIVLISTVGVTNSLRRDSVNARGWDRFREINDFSTLGFSDVCLFRLFFLGGNW